MRKPVNRMVSGFLDDGSGGIRTHVPLRTTAFRVRLVMTTSIRFHLKTQRHNYTRYFKIWVVFSLKKMHFSRITLHSVEIIGLNR